jgi:peptidoglycan glycosyltransferase
VNAALRRLSIFVLLMFLALLLNANYLQVVRASDLRSRTDNARVLLDEYSRQRGPILVTNRPVAASVATNDSLKYLRRYTAGPLYAPITGFYSVVYGATGIENAENAVLSGSDPSLFVRRIVDLLTGKQPRGGSVELTIDPKAQQAAYQGLAGRHGAVVAIDPSTGAILALATSPSYDPNLLSGHDGPTIRKNYNQLIADPAKPLLDRGILQTYPPGSTFKLVTASAAIESGKYVKDTKVYNGASLNLPQTSVNLPNDDNRPCNLTSSTATLEDALRRSCNAAFGDIGLKLGAQAVQDQAEKYGFNRRFQIPMITAKSTFPTDLNPPQTAQAAIGQFDVRATPLQMAMVVSAIANRGVLMRPHLVKAVRGPDLSVIDGENIAELDTAISPRTAAILTQMMVTVVEHGTGTNGQIPGVTVAGKTGTAQQGEGRPPHAWFVSFAPAENAKVAVAVLIEDGGGAPEVTGNKLAAPIAKSVMEAVLGQ